MSSQIELINPPELGKHPGYSHGAKTTGGSLLFVAGQVGWNEQQQIVSDDFAEQFSKALSNVLAVVQAAGGRPDTLVRLTLYVLDKREYLAAVKATGEAYRSQVGRHYPAMTLVEVKGLLEDRAKLELEATAVI